MGVPSKIQCSQAMAELLVCAGKGHWVKLCKDDVVAKGTLFEKCQKYHLE